MSLIRSCVYPFSFGLLIVIWYFLLDLLRAILITSFQFCFCTQYTSTQGVILTLACRTLHNVIILQIVDVVNTFCKTLHFVLTSVCWCCNIKMYFYLISHNEKCGNVKFPHFYCAKFVNVTVRLLTIERLKIF